MAEMCDDAEVGRKLKDPHHATAARESTPINPQRTLWTRLAIACLCMFFAHLSYFPLAGVYTSLNAEIGFVTFGVMWLSWAISSIFLAPPLVSSLGPRFTVFFGACCYLLFVTLNYYQSWATLVIAGAAEGLGGGFVWTGVLCSAANSATSLSQMRNACAEKYISMANGLVSLSYCAAALVGSAFSSAILLPTQTSLNFLVPGLIRVNGTLNDSALSWQNGELHSSVTNQTSAYGASSCIESTDAFFIPTWSYFTLVSVAFVGTAVSVVLSLALESMPDCQRTLDWVLCIRCRRRADAKNTPGSKSFLKQLQSLISTHYFPVFKCLTRLKYLVIVGLAFLEGVSQGFIFGTFSRHFISECLGVGVVGLAVIAWAFGSSLFSLVTGKVSPYISRCLVAILTALLQAGMILFMLFWQREPSYVMVFLTSLGWGIADGVWMTSPAIYISVVAEIDESRAAFGLVKGFLAFGGMTSFFASGYISIETNLWSILVLLIISCVFYIIGEKVFTPTSRPLDYVKNMSSTLCCSSRAIYVTDEWETKNLPTVRAVNPLVLDVGDQQEFDEQSIQDGDFVTDMTRKCT